MSCHAPTLDGHEGDYTVLESALLNDFDPREFLKYTAERQIVHGEHTLPWSRSV